MLDSATRQTATDAVIGPSGGDGRSATTLMPLVYDDLRALAGRYMQREWGYRTLQPTALVHEAYIRLIRVERIDWRDKTHFFAFAATQMRRILVEHARVRSRKRRGGDPERVTLQDTMMITPEQSVDLLSLDMALDRLARRSPRQGRVAELRLFSGMLVPEVAHVLGVSERTVKNDWKVAKAWLAATLNDSQRTTP
ncbi:MAG: ECF-type sigma factor [Acidimicrobiia bacterium]|nr:ECF-type sigma factor [Acidimicrobiia bacterium]